MNTNLLSSNLTNSAEIVLGEDILGIRGPVDIPSGWEWVWWTLGMLLSAVVLYFLLKRLWSRITKVRTPKIPVIPPHITARQRLTEAMQFIRDPYRFCTKVSDALREYLEGRFELQAPDRTTEEFLEELRHDSTLSPSKQDQVAHFLNLCDLAKFAKEQPSEAQLNHLHTTALGLVEETIPGPNDDHSQEKREGTE